MNDFPSMLKFLRERDNLSQRELAAKIGVSSSTIGMYESGERHPKPEIEEAIADFFNVDLNILRGRRIYEDGEAAKKSIINAYLEGNKIKEFTELFLNASPDDQERVVNYLKASKQLPDLPHLH